jgi:putative ABC transport system permease protein
MRYQKDQKCFTLRFLKWFCPDHLYEEIEGDLIQKFNRDTNALGERKARRRLMWNTVRFLRPGIILRNQISIPLNNASMFLNYLILASRNLIRNKVFAMINVLGLSVSMVVCILIFLYIRFELSYDDFHRGAENIYRVATKVTLQNEIINHEANTYEGISYALKEDFPEVRSATTVYKFDSDNNFIRYEDQRKKWVPIQTFKAFEIDENFFEVFSFPLKEGDPKLALTEPFSALISETYANVYFSGNAVGKFFETKNGTESSRYKITGIFQDVPPNSHIKFDLLTHSQGRTKNFLNEDIGFWDWTGQTYVYLNDPSHVAPLETKLNTFALANNELKNNKDDYGQVSTFEMQPLSKIHLYSNLQEELEVNGSITLVQALGMLAIIIMIIACVNYVNLSTAMSEERTKSIGVRKVIGASRGTLIAQVLTESALYNFISVTIAIVLANLLLPYFSTLANIPLDHTALYDKRILISMVLFTLVTTFLSGFYPSMIVSSVFTIRALKGRLNSGSNFNLRKVLVVFQFTATLVLIITSVVAYQQLSFMHAKELGININKVLIIKALNFDKETWSNADGGYVMDSAYMNKATIFKEDVRSSPSIDNVTALSHLPGNSPNWGTEFKAPENDPNKAYRLQAIGIDYDFISTLQAKLLAGRNFSSDFPSDRGNEGKRAVLINETASRLLGFKSPQDAVHNHINTYWGADYEIIGVVNSFHQLSLKENLQPLYFILQPRALEYFAVRYTDDDVRRVIKQVEKSWSHHFPDYPFNYFFLDTYFNRQYQYDQQFSSLVSLFSGVTLVIACLGLFGLTSYSIVQRTKEIGIRKILGATVVNVIGLFTHDLIKLILLASTIAIPLVFYVLSLWLENYAYKIDLAWWIFVGPILLILAIALITVSSQTVKVALKNPVESLKHE